MPLDSHGNTLWDWRSYFTQSALTAGQREYENNRIVSFLADPDGRWANGKTEGGFTVRVNRAPTNYREYSEYPDWRVLERPGWGQSPMASSAYYSCNCSQGVSGMRCRHLAALMFRWEAEHGPFVMAESEEERAARLKRQAEERLSQLRRALEIKKRNNRFYASEYFANRVKPAPKHLFFQPDRILENSGLQTNQYEAEAADALPDDALSDFSMHIEYGDRDRQMLSANARVAGQDVFVTVSQNRIVEMECGCGAAVLHEIAYWNAVKRPSCMCCHALALWGRLRQAVIRDNPGDSTDYQGNLLLALVAGKGIGGDAAEPDEASLDAKRQTLELTPRIVMNKACGAPMLSFDLGRAGEKSYAVKSLEGLAKAVEEESDYALGKAASASFAGETFTPRSQEWYQLIDSRVRAVRSVNARLSSGSYYQARKLPVGSGIPLEESDLDVVYDMTEGGSILYQHGARNETCPVRVGEARPRAEILLQPVKTGDRLTGVRVTGTIPRLLRGSRYQYALDTECFGRVRDDDLGFMSLFRAMDKSSGGFQCLIGEKKFNEFFYRVLPALREMPQVTVVDEVGSLVDGLLTPKPEFTFYIDLADRLTCGATVGYEDEVYPLRPGSDADVPRTRDVEQENRVTAAIRDLLPRWDPDGGLFWCDADEDNLARVLTEGVRALSRYGEVRGSDAFSRVRVRPVPRPRLSVSLEGGLLDLSVRTVDMSPEELLALLDSHRLKKRWHRLSSGDFVDLSDAGALDALEETAQGMDVSLEALVKDGARIPRYRALYVDRMLDAHNDVAAARDSHFKALIRSFQTIRDSDFEAPESLSDVLRPYQLYGFRWLSTLAQAGFGGILADEMGLGKTLQALAFLLSQKERGEQRPALVVCPASLVYNWREECRRFTPGLAVEAVAGTLPQRKALLRRAGEADLLVTSYDLLKRDVTLYDAVPLSTVILDEAQYIKNQHAAVSKAVRALKAERRFALTGTPIENRLSELWSIFDFLMPGFLYTAKGFSERFEAPILKRKDAEATEKLARMTEPFILRRLKTDVLKDLPEKLEEERRAELEEDQRRLYDAQLVRMRETLASSGDSGEDKLRILAQITRLRQLCCDPSLLFEDYRGSSAKRAACLDLIQSAMDAGHRMLVFSQFTSMLALLAGDLRGANIPFYTLTGATPKQERLRLVDAFNRGDTPVFLISLKAGGTGLNLTGADVVIHYDPWWNLAAQNQATDRAHRIGQTRQVTVVKLIAADTIEEKILRLQQTKRDLAEAILTGRNTSLMSLSKDELLALLA